MPNTTYVLSHEDVLPESIQGNIMVEPLLITGWAYITMKAELLFPYNEAMRS